MLHENEFSCIDIQASTLATYLLYFSLTVYISIVSKYCYIYFAFCLNTLQAEICLGNSNLFTIFTYINLDLC